MNLSIPEGCQSHQHSRDHRRAHDSGTSPRCFFFFEHSFPGISASLRYPGYRLPSLRDGAKPQSHALPRNTLSPFPSACALAFVVLENFRKHRGILLTVVWIPRIKRLDPKNLNREWTTVRK